MKGLKTMILAFMKTAGIDLGEKAPAVESELDRLEAESIKASTANNAPAGTAGTTGTTGTTGNPDITKMVKEAVEAATGGFSQEVKTLTDMLGAERLKNEAAAKAMEEKQKADRAVEIDTLIKASLGTGKFTKEKEADWKARLTENYDVAKAILAELPDNPAIVRADKKTGEQTNGQKSFGTQSSGSAAEQYKSILENANEAFKTN